MKKSHIFFLFLTMLISGSGYSQTPVSGDFSTYYPAQNATLYDHTSLFKWSASENAQYYILQIASDSLFNGILFESAGVTGLSVSVILPGVYSTWCYWRVLAFDTASEFIPSQVCKYRRFTPGGVEGLAVWLSADSVNVNESGKVDTMYDKSGNNRHAVQTVAAKQPVYVAADATLNNQPSVYYNGASNLTSTFAQTLVQPNTTFTIWKKNDFTNRVVFDGINVSLRHTIFSMVNDIRVSASLNFTYPKSDCRNYMISTVIFYGNNTKVYDNSALVRTGDAGTSGLSGLQLGVSYIGDAFMLGNIPEMIVYHKEITTEEQQQIETYLRYKYFPEKVQPPVNLGPDIKVDYGFCDTILRAGPDYASYLWSTGETSESIAVKKSGLYAVTVIDTFGIASYDEVKIAFADEFDLQDMTICYGDTAFYQLPLHFSTSGYSFLWPDMSADNSWRVSAQGTYPVVVTDTNGCSFTEEFTVTVDSFYQNVDLGNTTGYCGGDSIRITALSDYAGLSYLWQDGSTEDYYIAHTDELIWVEVTNERGCRGRDSLNVSIAGLVPIVDFSSSLTCFKQAMDFTNLSAPQDASVIIGYAWSFGNGSVSTEINPSVTYPVPGFYTVILEAETDIGCKASARQNVFVHNLPAVDFTPQIACQHDTVPFVNLSASESEIVYTKWDFGNGDVALSYTPQYAFPEHGSYEVTLTERTIYGCTDSLVRTVQIYRKPVISIVASSLCVNAIGYFSADVETEIWNPIQSWEWRLDGHPVSSQPTYAMLLTSLSSPLIALDVQALNGCRAHAEEIFTVYPVPVAGFENPDGCLDMPYSFVNTSLDSTAALYSVWSIDGHTVTETAPVYTFSGTGTYPVKLTVTNEGNCKQDITRDVMIHPLPEVDFAAAYSDTLIGMTLAFDNLSSADATHFLWDFGDGGYSTEHSPLYTYPAEGNYHILLTGTTDLGCRNSVSHAFNIVYPVFDIAVRNLQLNVKEGYLQPSVLVLNQSNRTVTRIDFIIEINRYIFQERWEGVLNAGEVMTFWSASKISTGDQPSGAACITAILDYVNDIDPDNNSACRYDNESFVFYSLAPNPAVNDITARYYIPEAESITIEVMDIFGQKIYSQRSEMPQGIHTAPISVELFPSGIYFFRISSDDKVLKTEKFLKY